jgi:hypothetical protein
MRKPTVLVAPMAAALAAAGLAVAHGVPGTIAKAQASFDLDPTDRIRTRECRGADGHTFRIARGVWRGEIDFDLPANADVPAAFRGEIVVDTTTGDGFARGLLRSGPATAGLAGSPGCWGWSQAAAR